MAFSNLLSKITLFSLILIPFTAFSAEEEALGGVLEEIVVTSSKKRRNSSISTNTYQCFICSANGS